MNNEISLTGNVAGLSDGQLQVVMNKLMQTQIARQDKKLAEVKDEVEKLKEEVKINAETTQSQLELERKSHRVEKHRFGFVSASDLGQCYQVSIGSKTMGKLLRLVGLAKSKQKKTEPLRSATLNGYAKSDIYVDYPVYKWNPEKCIKKIDKWLDKQGLIDEFYAIEDETKLMKYINELAVKFGEV